MSSRFSVISTFSGCGGSSLGYKLAGGKVLLAVEWDDNAVATYRANFPNTPIYHGDIAELSVDECCRLAGVSSGELDILDGSPPCQGFSTIGQREFGDSRNQLFREFARLLEGLQPKTFVMENVAGMVKGKMKLIFAEVLRQLKGCGYRVSARLMDAQYFRVPQRRKRLIFIGVREDLSIQPSHPKAQARPLTIHAALKDLHQTDADLQPALLKPTWQMWRVLQGLEPSRHFGLVTTHWTSVCPTIVKDAGNTTTGMIHPNGKRRFTIPEIKRLASFPDDFVFAGSFKEQWARIGNAVPPNFMRAIAEHIRDNILEVSLT